MRTGFYIAQTWNKARGPYDVSRYAAGPGVLARCWKCPTCGKSLSQ